MAASNGPQDASVAYFITVRTFGCKSVFDAAPMAETVVDVIEAKRREVGFKKYAYAVLPDHYHLLLGGGPDSQSVADVVIAINRAVEHFSGQLDDGQPLWDAKPEVLVLYTSASRVEKLNYIHNKPVLCGLVDSAEDYEFSSARFYHTRYGKTEF